MKKYFITGLIILLPLAVTIGLVAFIINLLTQPFVNFIDSFLTGITWYDKYATFIRFLLQILLIFGIFFFTVLLGFLARVMVFRSLLTFYDYILHRIPVIKTVYKATQQVIRTIFGSTSRSFKQVVMVPFPIEKGAYCIGLVSSPAPSICENTVGTKLISVFVPTTPNPTSGFLMMYQEDSVIYLDMKIEDAFKYIISCGVITSDDIDLPPEISP